MVTDDYKALLDDLNEQITEAERLLAERFDISGSVKIPGHGDTPAFFQLHWAKSSGDKERQLCVVSGDSAPLAPLRYAPPIVRCMCVIELPRLMEELQLSVDARRCHIVNAIEVVTAAVATMDGGEGAAEACRVLALSDALSEALSAEPRGDT